MSLKEYLQVAAFKMVNRKNAVSHEAARLEKIFMFFDMA